MHKKYQYCLSTTYKVVVLLQTKKYKDTWFSSILLNLFINAAALNKK